MLIFNIGEEGKGAHNRVEFCSIIIFSTEDLIVSFFYLDFCWCITFLFCFVCELEILYKSLVAHDTKALSLRKNCLFSRWFSISPSQFDLLDIKKWFKNKTKEKQNDPPFKWNECCAWQLPWKFMITHNHTSIWY